MKHDNEIKIMNCLDVCRHLKTDSYSDDVSIKTHLASCDSCTAYAAQQTQLNNSLEHVINIKAPDGLASRILLQQSINEKHQSGKRRNRYYAVAASMLLGISVITAGLIVNAPDSLQQVALNHVKNEQQHLSDNNNVQLVKLNDILQEFNIRLDSSLGKINYAGSCMIRNSKGVHIVVQAKTGPVTILLMPDEQLKERQDLSDAKFSGSVVPIEKGSFAIIGGKQESLFEIETRFKYGLNYI